MANRFFQEAPIKHTSGGEMPDTSQKASVNPEDLESFGGFEQKAKSFPEFDDVREYLPVVVSVVGFVISGVLFYRFFRKLAPYPGQY